LKKICVFIFLLLCFPTLLKASWTQEEIETITSEIQKKLPFWKIEETVEILKTSESRGGKFIDSRQNDEGKKIIIEIMGKTILLDGKDITGNLGSKITHGNYSPILENIDNSPIAVGDQAIATKETKKTNINIAFIFAISLSIPLSVSFVFNIILFRKLKKKRKSRNN
jgi:hypothetical protein